MPDPTALTPTASAISITSTPEFDRLVEMIAPVDESAARVILARPICTVWPTN